MNGRSAWAMAIAVTLAGCAWAAPSGVVAETRTRDEASCAVASNAIASSASEPAAAAAPRAVHGVRCATVWDPERGAIADGRVVFDGDRIAGIGPATAIAAPPGEVDLRPLFCMPGLVDAHTHLTSYAHEGDDDSLERQRAEAVKNARRTIEAGVTSVRDLGAGSGGVDLWLRARIAEGAVIGPRMECAGTQIGNGGAVGGRTGAVAKVDAHARAGVDVIKLFATGGANVPARLMSADEIAAATAEAHRLGLRVAVHAITAPSIDDAVAAGVDSIEHAPDLRVDEARAMAAKGITLVPTLYILRYYIEDAANLAFDDEHVASLRRLVDARVVPFEARFPSILATGVKVAFGSDSFMALHGKNARELALLVRAGMKPDEALRAATATSAELLGRRGKVGTLAPGAYADLIAMPGDPRARIDVVEQVAVVIAGGAIIRDARR